MADLLYMYNKSVPYSYGRALLDAGKILEKKGYDIKFFDLERFVKEYDFDDKIIKEQVEEIKPKTIISYRKDLLLSMHYYANDWNEDKLGTFNSNYKKATHNKSAKIISFLKAMDTTLTGDSYYQTLEEELDTFLINNFWGIIQTNGIYNHQNSLEFKVPFIEIMRKENIPIPKTVLRKEVPKSEWNYDSLNSMLNYNSENNEIILKDVTKQKSRGIYLINQHKECPFNNPNIQIAQRRIKSKINTPYSLRIVTFPNEIIGATLYYNTDDSFRSNIAGNVKHIALNLREMKEINHKRYPELNKILSHHGINRDLTIKDEIRELALKISKIPSQSLLKGIDIIFDEKNNPYVLEAQTLPGTPHKHYYTLIRGKKWKSYEESIQLASEVLAESLENYLVNYLPTLQSHQK